MTIGYGMSHPTFIELFLSCGSWQEAQRITDSLLEKQLVVGVEFIPVRTKHFLRGTQGETEAVKLIMQCKAHLFDEIEKEVATLHSHEDFLLHPLPVGGFSQKALEWVGNELTYGKT